MDKRLTPFQEDLTSVQLPDLSVLQNQNILVTGATGLVGSALVELLCLYADQYNYEIYAGCRSVEKFHERFWESICARLHFFYLDVTKPICNDIPFENIFHAASGANPAIYSSDPVGVMKANLLGTIMLLDYGIANGLKRFVYISSGEAYGEGCQTEWNEKDSGYVDSMSVRACYPSSKRAAETLCATYSYQYGIEAKVARLSHTYGPCFTDYDNRAYAEFIKNILNDENIVLKSPGEQFRSWIYVVDCVAALIYILVNGKKGEAYNVADNNSNITIRCMAETIAQIAGRTVIFKIPSEQPANSTPITRAIFNCNKLQSLGWTAKYSIIEGLTNTIYSLKQKL